MEEYKDLEEIIELCEEELNNNDENVTAILDLTDLKNLRNLINKYKEYKECLEVTSQALNNIAYDQIPIAIGDLEAEIEKKDKIIDLILEEMTNNHLSIRDIVEEEICDDRCIENNNWTCFKHIKEYFENKVKESK